MEIEIQGLKAIVQGRLVGVNQRDGKACHQESHGNAAPHGARADNAHVQDAASGGVAVEVCNFGGVSLRAKEMP